VRRFFLAVVVSALFASVVHARTAFPIEAKLVIPYTRILPGVPFEMWVELYNPSQYTVHTSVCLPLQMRPTVGKLEWHCDRTCMSKMEERWRRLKASGATPAAIYLRNADVVLAPGERKSLVLPIRDRLDTGELFDEMALSVSAGRTLLISVQLCFIDWPENMGHPASIKPAPHIGEPLVTNEVAVDIVEPTGNDAKVWERMLSTSHGTWTPYTAATVERSFWKGVLTDFPDSNYAPYALLVTDPSSVDWHQDLDAFLAAIRRFPDSPAIDLLHLSAFRFATAVQLPDVARREEAILRASKRPTTRTLLCPPENGCDDDGRPLRNEK